MNERETYKYDVAFSFLQQDEGVAREIADKLGNSFSTFIYSERQAELAGTDGELRFNLVFGTEARIAAVLYRSDWGDTPWTRIEKTAIQNRSLQEGYDFTVFILLQADATLPRWVPKNRIWYNYHKFGAEGAAASLENRVSEIGGGHRPETVAEQATRIENSLMSANRRKLFLESEAAIGPAEAEASDLLSEIKALAERVSKDSPVFHINVKLEGSTIVLKDAGFLLRVDWLRRFRNSLADSRLSVALLEAEREHGIVIYNPKYRDIYRHDFVFSLNESDEGGWRNTTDQKRFRSSTELADDLIRQFIEKVEKHYRGNLS